MEPPPEPFNSLLSSVEQLETFLGAQTINSTPAILCQPPSLRPARRENLNMSSSLLATEWNAIQNSLARLFSLRSKLLQQRQACRHASHPISALPPELLQLVFSFLPRDQYHGATMAITQVCQKWRSLTLDYKELWAIGRIGSWLNFEPIALPLSRSGPNHPFDLVIDRTYHDDIPGLLPIPIVSSKTTAIKRALKPRLRSIKWAGSVSVRGSLAELLGELDPTGIDYISVDLPLLEEIVYDTPVVKSQDSWVAINGEVDASIDGIYLDGARCPKLRRLTVIGGCLKGFSLSHPILHEHTPLTSLTLKSTSLDPIHIRYMFHSNPNLKIMDFCEVKGIKCSDTDSSAKIQLYPQDFRMQNCTDGLVVSILEYTNMSRAVTMIIQLHEYWDYEEKPDPWCGDSLGVHGHTVIALTTQITNQVRATARVFAWIFNTLTALASSFASLIVS